MEIDSRPALLEKLSVGLQVSSIRGDAPALCASPLYSFHNRHKVTVAAGRAHVVLRSAAG